MEKRTYFAGKISQRGKGNAVEFATFIANAKDISKWAGIRRVGEHDKGTQRILKPARAKAIERFLTKDTSNTIPTSIVVAFLPDVVTFTSYQSKLSNCIENIDFTNGAEERIDWGAISFEFDPNSKEFQRPALIVDGQHRLRGMESIDEDIPTQVVALLDASAEEQAFQFVVINNKSAKVPTDNVKAIISDVTENDLQERLSKAGVNYGDIPAVLRDVNDRSDSPFHNLLDWPLNPDEENRTIKLNTIESCLRYLRNQIPAVTDHGDDETEKEVFLSIWKAISKQYSMLWKQNEKFMSKVSINAFNEFVVERLENAWVDETIDLYEMENIESYVSQLANKITSEFWLKEWNTKLQDNSVVRDLIKNDLRIISHNARNPKKSWNEGLKLLGES